jgi:Zn-dependent protease with chaperone function
MFPSRIVLLGFATLLPSRYDAYGYVWAGAFLFVLTLSHAGGSAFLLRALGFFRPARERVQQLLANAARVAGVSNVLVYELAYARANALALPLSSWIVLTTAAVEGLAPPELEAIAAHELGHLREPLSVKWFRVAGGALLFLPLGLIPIFPEQPAYGLVAGCAALVVGSLLFRVASRRLEQRADALAHHQVGEHELYGRALERIYQMNWAPAVVRGQLHPNLYDRMTTAGVEPGYARPRPPARGLLFVASALGILFGVMLNMIVLGFAQASPR